MMATGPGTGPGGPSYRVGWQAGSEVNALRTEYDKYAPLEDLRPWVWRGQIVSLILGAPRLTILRAALREAMPAFGSYRPPGRSGGQQRSSIKLKNYLHALESDGCIYRHEEYVVGTDPDRLKWWQSQYASGADPMVDDPKGKWIRPVASHHGGLS